MTIIICSVILMTAFLIYYYGIALTLLFYIQVLTLFIIISPDVVKTAYYVKGYEYVSYIHDFINDTPVENIDHMSYNDTQYKVGDTLVIANSFCEIPLELTKGEKLSSTEMLSTVDYLRSCETKITNEKRK